MNISPAVIRFSTVAAVVVACVSAVLVASDQSKPVPGEPAPFGAPTELTATLADPINIDLKWKDNASNEAGYFVEYSPDANDEYLIIEALPPNSTSYRHPHLLPETRFVFRVRPFFGLASNVASITTGKEAPQQDVSEKVSPPAPEGTKSSLKSVATLADAAPTDLAVTLIPPSGVRLAWKDRAKDADGYLLEIKSPENDFRPSAFLEPGSSSLTTYNFPFETKFEFRVRAFVYGQPSNLAEQTTGQDPTMNVPASITKPAEAGKPSPTS